MGLSIVINTQEVEGDTYQTSQRYMGPSFQIKFQSTQVWILQWPREVAITRTINSKYHAVHRFLCHALAHIDSYGSEMRLGSSFPTNVLHQKTVSRESVREIECRMKGTRIKAIQEQNRPLDSKRNIIGRQGKRALSKGFKENDGTSVQILDEAKRRL